MRRLFRKDPGSAAGLGLGRGAARAESSARLGAPEAVAIGAPRRDSPGSRRRGAPRACSSPG